MSSADVDDAMQQKALNALAQKFHSGHKTCDIELLRQSKGFDGSQFYTLS